MGLVHSLKPGFHVLEETFGLVSGFVDGFVDVVSNAVAEREESLCVLNQLSCTIVIPFWPAINSQMMRLGPALAILIAAEKAAGPVAPPTDVCWREASVMLTTLSGAFVISATVPIMDAMANPETSSRLRLRWLLQALDQICSR